jgi:uncharacterized membrane protein
MSTPKLALLIGMSLFYIVAGVAHFVKPSFYLAMMPPSLPAPTALIAISGVAEIVLGLAVLVPATRVYAAWGIVALLLAVFPANIYAAVAGIPGTGGFARLPFQAVFLAWAWWYTRP